MSIIFCTSNNDQHCQVLCLQSRNTMKYHRYTWAFVLTFFFASVGFAQGADLETHSAYKVTTYNLGTVVDFEGATNVDVQDYEPLMITSTAADVLGADRSALFGTATERASSGFAVSAQFNATQNIALQGAIGMTKNAWASATLADQKSSWEANLGVIYRLFSNLNYEVHFGYMDTGDLFKERSDYSDVESIIMISNKLTMSF